MLLNISAVIVIVGVILQLVLLCLVYKHKHNVTVTVDNNTDSDKCSKKYCANFNTDECDHCCRAMHDRFEPRTDKVQDILINIGYIPNSKE